EMSDSSIVNPFVMSQIHAHISSAQAPSETSVSTVPAEKPQSLSDSIAWQKSVWNPDRAGGTAQAAEQIARGDLRVALQTEKLGNVELHARVAGDQLGAAIMVEKKDAHAILATELPALHQALSEKQFRVEQLSLLHGSLDAAGGNAQQSFSQQSGTPQKVRLAHRDTETAATAFPLATGARAAML